jgi:hypothetical protein
MLIGQTAADLSGHQFIFFSFPRKALPARCENSCCNGVLSAASAVEMIQIEKVLRRKGEGMTLKFYHGYLIQSLAVMLAMTFKLILIPSLIMLSIEKGSCADCKPLKSKACDLSPASPTAGNPAKVASASKALELKKTTITNHELFSLLSTLKEPSLWDTFEVCSFGSKSRLLPQLYLNVHPRSKCAAVYQMNAVKSAEVSCGLAMTS